MVPPCSLKRGKSASQKTIVDFRFASRTWSMSFSPYEPAGPKMPTPAALTRRSIAPRRSAASIARSAVSGCEASPRPLRDTPTTAIRGPSSSAIARPSPEDAPVTIATMLPVYDSPMPLVVDLAVPVHILVLMGGGGFSFGETREIDDFLLAHLERKSVAFLPTASGSAEDARHFGAYPRRETTN